MSGRVKQHKRNIERARGQIIVSVRKKEINGNGKLCSRIFIPRALSERETDDRARTIVCARDKPKERRIETHRKRRSRQCSSNNRTRRKVAVRACVSRRRFHFLCSAGPLARSECREYFEAIGKYFTPKNFSRREATSDKCGHRCVSVSVCVFFLYVVGACWLRAYLPVPASSNQPPHPSVHR